VKDIFTTGYNHETASKEEERLWNAAPLAGCFIKLGTSDLKEYVMDTERRNDWAKRVGYLSSDRNSVFGGTCFRVGEKYIMTALHVIISYIDGGM